MPAQAGTYASFSMCNVGSLSLPELLLRLTWVPTFVGMTAFVRMVPPSKMIAH